ncbi:MAG: sugar phosphate isomerase/epimerase family protein [Planctomycetota bacterium]
MKLALQHPLIPGNTPADQARWALDHGVAAVELNGFAVKSLDGLRALADAFAQHLPVCALCGNFDPATWAPSFDFVHRDAARREASIAHAAELLELCGAFAMVGQVVPPGLFKPPAPQPEGEAVSAASLERELIVEACRALGPVAASHGTRLIVEPLNRYEQRQPNTVADAAAIVDDANTEGLGIVPDTFHMNIEEDDLAASIHAIGVESMVHFHLGDNQRREPGSGAIDFEACFEALRAIGYDGHVSLECGITGDTTSEKAASLAASCARLDALLTAHV